MVIGRRKSDRGVSRSYRGELRLSKVVTSLKKKTLSELSDLFGGYVEGDGAVVITGVCSLDNQKAGCIALAENPERIKWAKNAERPGALIVGKSIDVKGLPLLVADNPRLVFTKALRHFYPEDEFEGGVDPSAVVSSEAVIDETAWVGPCVVIESGARIESGVRVGASCYMGERVEIGKGSYLHPNVTILKDVKVGKRCIFQSGAVIGSDGFGYTPTSEGNIKVPQVGGVIIGDDVEIGANTAIDRATLDMTIIENDVKIDNLVQVAHNVRIGEHTRIAAQTGITGRVTIEKDVVVGGQAGFQNGITVGEGSRIGGRAGVTKSVPKKSTISGYPADDHKKTLQLLALQKRLPEVMSRLKEIERKLDMEKETEV
jgi:UDP-3-O-[3-hydroxymyristoyl] glucosamine N-acyltransferase